MALDMHNDHLLIAFAQQGHPEAIAAMLNYYFNERQIWVKVGWEDETLILLCEAIELPSPSIVSPLFAQILDHLNIQRGSDAILYGRVQDEDDPRWQVPLAGILSGVLPEAISEETLIDSDVLEEDADDSASFGESPSSPEQPRSEDETGQQPMPDTQDLSNANVSPPANNSGGSDAREQRSSQLTEASGEQSEPLDSSPEDSDRFLCCILGADSSADAQELETVLFPIESIRSILHISCEAILPVPYMAPCVLGLYPSGSQMLWVVDLWQQLTNKRMSDRPNSWANRFITLVIQDQESNELVGFAIPQLEDQIYHCPPPQRSESSSLPEPMVPFSHQYDPVSRRAILSIDALIQDPRLQMHRT